MIFVIDSTDRRRIGEAKLELISLASHFFLRDSVILVYANKQDSPQAMSVMEVTAELGMATNFKNRKWYVQGCVATEGRGLYDGLEFLCDTLNNY